MLHSINLADLKWYFQKRLNVTIGVEMKVYKNESRKPSHYQYCSDFTRGKYTCVLQ